MKKFNLDINDFYRLTGFIFGGGILFVLIFALLYLLNGFVLSVVWGWLIVPIFNLPIINIPQAIGILLVVNYVVNFISRGTGGHGCNEKELSSLFQSTLEFVKPFIVLFAAWIITFFI